MVKNIYIVTSNFPPTNIVGALRPYRLTKHISASGWKPIIVTYAPKSSQALDYSLLEVLSPDTEICYINTVLANKNIINITELPDVLDEYFTNKNNQFSEKYNRTVFARGLRSCIDMSMSMLRPDPDLIWVLPMVRRILSIMNQSDESVILTTSPPHSIHVAGLIINRLKNVSWIADFRDPWDAYIFTGRYELISLVDKYIEKRIMQYADAVISTTKTAADVLKDRHQDMPATKFHTITNTYDSELVSGEYDKNPDYFVISYTGIFYPDKDPYTFFRALRTWIDNIDSEKYNKYVKRLKVKLIGSKDRTTEDVISNLNLHDIVEFIERVPHEKAIRLTMQSDMVLISTGIGSKTRPGWLPSKFIEYLGCKIPILAITREGEMANYIRQTNSGYVITGEDHESIYKLLESEIDRKFHGKKIDLENKLTFDGVEVFEEKKVINDMISIIESIK